MKLKHLDLSHNQFRETGGDVLGFAIGRSNSNDRAKIITLY